MFCCPMLKRQNSVVSAFHGFCSEPAGVTEVDVILDSLEDGKVLAEKQAFIEKHGLVVWRFHDH